MNEYYNINDISKLNDEDNKRIKYLKIPPNWKFIQISKDPSSKIQVIGFDSKNRKQYIYHPLWVDFSKKTKYMKINDINFKKFENVIKKYSIFNNEYSKNYLISNMLILMKDLNIRVGNEKYYEENNSVGLCTLTKNHYKKIKNNNEIIYKLIFKGKKGILHEKILNTQHINFIENIYKLPGNLLFKYEQKNINQKIYKKIISDDINNFLKKYVDINMTSKDIRTYCANNIYRKELNKFLKNGFNEKKAKLNALKITSLALGNTPKVCRDSYINN